MKRTIVWALIGLIGLAAAEPEGFAKLAESLGGSRNPGALLGLLYAAAFAVMNAGYLAESRGRRHFKLHGAAPGTPVRVAVRPLAGWARVELCIAPDHLAYARELRRTPLVIALAAAAWLAATAYSYHLVHAWWLSAALAVIGALHVWSLFARSIVIGSTHGTEDVLYGSAAQTAQLRQHLVGLLGAAVSREFTTATWSSETATVLNRVPITSTEQAQEIQWAMILLGVLGMLLAAKSSAPALGVVGLALLIAGLLLSRPSSVARFEGGASLPVPNEVYTGLAPGTAA